MTHPATIVAFCCDFGEVTATKNSKQYRGGSHAHGCWDVFPATHAAGARMVLKWAEWGVSEADMG